LNGICRAGMGDSDYCQGRLCSCISSLGWWVGSAKPKTAFTRRAIRALF